MAENNSSTLDLLDLFSTAGVHALVRALHAQQALDEEGFAFTSEAQRKIGAAFVADVDRYMQSDVGKRHSGPAPAAATKKSSKDERSLSATSIRYGSNRQATGWPLTIEGMFWSYNQGLDNKDLKETVNGAECHIEAADNVPSFLLEQIRAGPVAALKQTWSVWMVSPLQTRESALLALMCFFKFGGLKTQATEEFDEAQALDLAEALYAIEKNSFMQMYGPLLSLVENLDSATMTKVRAKYKNDKELYKTRYGLDDAKAITLGVMANTAFGNTKSEVKQLYQVFSKALSSSEWETILPPCIRESPVIIANAASRLLNENKFVANPRSIKNGLTPEDAEEMGRLGSLPGRVATFLRDHLKERAADPAATPITLRHVPAMVDVDDASVKLRSRMMSDNRAGRGLYLRHVDHSHFVGVVARTAIDQRNGGVVAATAPVAIRLADVRDSRQGSNGAYSDDDSSDAEGDPADPADGTDSAVCGKRKRGDAAAQQRKNLYIIANPDKTRRRHTRRSLNLTAVTKRSPENEEESRGAEAAEGDEEAAAANAAFAAFPAAPEKEKTEASSCVAGDSDGAEYEA